MKLINGDCFEVMQEMEDESTDLIITDPPYGIDFTSPRETSKFHGTRIINDDNLDWLPMWAELVYKVSKNIVVVFTGWSTLGDFQRAFESVGFTLKNVLVWDKMWFGMGHNYRPNYELIMLLCKTNFTIEANNKSNILSHRRIAPTKLLHSCEKPLSLLMELISDLSQPGDLILDCFMGSGSTGVAAMKTNRDFIGIEIDPHYFSIAGQRIMENLE